MPSSSNQKRCVKSSHVEYNVPDVPWVLDVSVQSLYKLVKARLTKAMDLNEAGFESVRTIPEMLIHKAAYFGKASRGEVRV